MRKLFILTLLLAVIDLSFSTTYTCSSSSSCGCSAYPATLTKIVGGETASSQTWSWAVSLLIGNSLCGGSIISSSWILTAAHCVYGSTASQVTVCAGSIYKLTGTQIRYVSSITMHPSYNPTTHANDIALLRLSSPLNMSDPRVKTICIPSVSSATLSAGEWPPAGTTVVAVGWGLTTEGGYSTSSILRQVTMQTVDRLASTCTPVLNSWAVQFCASSTCKDTCQGDSGGPLMAFTSSNQWVLVGATSYGIGCARASSAGVYTRVAYYQSWIASTTSNQYTNPTSSSLTSSTTEIDPSAVCTASIHYISILSFSLGFALLLASLL